MNHGSWIKGTHQVRQENLVGFLVLAGVAVAVLLLGTFAPAPGDDTAEVSTPASSARIAGKAAQYPLAREIVAPAGFINTPDGAPITIQEFIGAKVILLDIWTYSCINCVRTLPYLRAWHEKYADEGLLIIGIHTPEFAFEKEIENVRAATERFGITWPVVLDNDRGTWTAYRNQYWPRKYLIDIDGFVVYDHIGEGGYEETEAKMQELVKERADVRGERTEFADGTVDPKGVEGVDITRPRTPELYLGAWRNEGWGNGEPLVQGDADAVVPREPAGDAFYLGGRWNIAQEFAENRAAGARIVLPYQASKVHMVLAPSEAALALSPSTESRDELVEGVKVRVRLDGAPITEADAGDNVIFGDGEPYILVDHDGLYRIVETAEGWGRHTFELIVDGPGLEVYTFTFG